MMENKIISLAKSSFTSPAQKTSKYHIFLKEEKHGKRENWIENKYRTYLSWRLEGKRSIYLKGKMGTKEASPSLPQSIRLFGKKKKGSSSGTASPFCCLVNSAWDRGRKEVQPVLGVPRGHVMGQQLQMLWASAKMPLSGSVRFYAFTRLIYSMCPGTKSLVTSSSSRVWVSSPGVGTGRMRLGELKSPWF